MSDDRVSIQDFMTACHDLGFKPSRIEIAMSALDMKGNIFQAAARSPKGGVMIGYGPTLLDALGACLEQVRRRVATCGLGT